MSARFTLRLAFVALAVSACAGRTRSRCEEVCAREAECMREQNPEATWDVGECVDACAQLEREPSLARQVERHTSCVAEAPGCAQVLECP